MFFFYVNYEFSYCSNMGIHCILSQVDCRVFHCDTGKSMPKTSAMCECDKMSNYETQAVCQMCSFNAVGNTKLNSVKAYCAITAMKLLLHTETVMLHMMKTCLTCTTKTLSVFHMLHPCGNFNVDVSMSKRHVFSLLCICVYAYVCVCLLAPVCGHFDTVVCTVGFFSWFQNLSVF